MDRLSPTNRGRMTNVLLLTWLKEWLNGLSCEQKTHLVLKLRLLYRKSHGSGWDEGVRDSNFPRAGIRHGAPSAAAAPAPLQYTDSQTGAPPCGNCARATPHGS